jgi:hypothetical protein
MTIPIDPLETAESLEDREKREAEERANYIASIDDPNLDSIWRILNHYKEEYSANISEIALGLQLSRPVVTEFLGNGKKRGENEPKFSRGRILSLFKELTKEEKLERKDGKKLTKPQEKRRKLKEDGADELLIAAGFTPENIKTVFVSPLLEPQLTFISCLYENQPLSSDLFSQVIKTQIDSLRTQQFEKIITKHKQEQKQIDSSTESKNSEKDLKDRYNLLDELTKNINLIDKIKNNIRIDSKTTEIVVIKYNQMVKSMKRNDDLTDTESAGLLKSVLNNRLNKCERFDLNLIVLGVERTSLSIHWPVETHSSQLLQKIKMIGGACENILRSSSIKKNDGDQTQTVDLSADNPYPVTRTIVNCKYENSNDKIDFECISTGTQLGTAASAIVYNMGFKHCISKMEMGMTWLGQDIGSLVDTVATITDTSGRVVAGEWVSADLIQSLLQALKIAGNKWFYQHRNTALNTSSYQLIIERTAKLKADFYRCRRVSDQFDIDNEPNDIREFQNIIERAEANISLINQLPEIVRDTFLNTSHRIQILAQLYRLHDFNTKVNRKRCNTFIEEIQNKLACENKKNAAKVKSGIDVDSLFLISARISLSVEKIAYNLSFGTHYHNTSIQKIDTNEIEKCLEEDLLQSHDIIGIFKRIDKKIEIEIEKCKKDPGYDIYHSLGSYHSIVGRLLFYRGGSEILDEAFERFLRAAYYFQRIGLTIKVQRSLALAGRIKVRCRDAIMADLCMKLSASVVEESKTRLGVLKKTDFLKSIESRVQLLQAEDLLITSENSGEAIVLCLKALKGALKLGLNRHIMDIIYTIYECTKDLQGREVKDDLLGIFFELKEEGGVNKLIEDGGNNQVASRIANELNSNIQLLINSTNEARVSDESRVGGERRVSGERRVTYWGDTTEQLGEFLMNTWNRWYRDASGDKNGEHPFSVKIKNDEFLKPINLI